MKVHLAAQPERREAMVRIARRLEEAGHTVTSRWIHGNGSGATAVENAMYELADVMAANCVVVFTDNPKARPRLGSSAGRQVEFGYGLRARKRLIIIGPLESIFCRLPEVERARNVSRLIDLLSRSGGATP